MKCCICGNECEDEFGNNPWPISENENDRCCNACNGSQVIPARIFQMLDRRENGKKQS